MKIILAAITSICILLSLSTFSLQLIGLKSTSVVTGSMAPTIPQGSLAIINPSVKGEQIQTGDVVAFNIGQQEGHLCLHRAITVNSEGGDIVTQGDANTSADLQPVRFSSVRGKVIASFPYLGYALVWANSNWIYIVMMGSASVLMVIACFLAQPPNNQSKNQTKGALCQLLQKQHNSQA